MCLTNTVDAIDFDALNPKQKENLEKLKTDLEARRKSLQDRLTKLDQGLAKLTAKLNDC